MSTKVSTLFGREYFCPPNLENSDRLRYYSSVFDYIQVNSPSFYRIPNQSVRNWLRESPNIYRFTAKFPRIIRHDKQLVNRIRKQNNILMSWNLKRKKLALLIQIHPFMEIIEF